MFAALLVLLVLDCLALMVVILLQAGKGGGLAAGFGGAGTGIEMMGSRQTATFLHNATRWLGGAFLVICFVLSLLAARSTGPRSLIESEMQDQPAAAEEGPATGAPAELGGTPTGEAPAQPALPGQVPAQSGAAPDQGAEAQTRP